MAANKRANRCYCGPMGRIGAVLLLAGAAFAGPKVYPDCIGDKDKILEIARTRGKLIFLTVMVDHDGENRAVIDAVFRDKDFVRLSKQFVCVLANPEDKHGRIKHKDKKTGKKHIRCADCPTITCEQHMHLAQHWSRAFFEENEIRTPVHFVIDSEEEVVHTIMNGSFDTGFNHVSGKIVIAELKKILKKHGRGLTEEEYARMTKNLASAKAARARDKTELELQLLLKVVSLNRKVEAVAEARKRVQEIDAWAGKKLAAARKLVAEKEWEAAIDGLVAIKTKYAGTLTAAAAAKLEQELRKDKTVKKLLKAKATYEKAMRYKAKGKTDLAKKKFAQCVRQGGATKYASLAKKELAALGG